MIRKRVFIVVVLLLLVQKYSDFKLILGVAMAFLLQRMKRYHAILYTAITHYFIKIMHYTISMESHSYLSAQ